MIFSKAQALELCTLNMQAYTLATTGHCVLPDGFTAPIAIRMAGGDRPFFLRHDPLDIWGFVTTKVGLLHVVFRGTQFTSGWDFGQEWAEDAWSLPLKQLGPGKVHIGFYGAWEALRQPAIDAATAAGCDIHGPKVVTGHSLGASIATLCWGDLGGDLMTFASPRVGDPQFGTALWDGQTVRIFNHPDVVPKVPSDPPFRHGGTPIEVQGPGSVFDLGAAHALPSYQAGLQKLP